MMLLFVLLMLVCGNTGRTAMEERVQRLEQRVQTLEQQLGARDVPPVQVSVEGPVLDAGLEWEVPHEARRWRHLGFVASDVGDRMLSVELQQRNLYLHISSNNSGIDINIDVSSVMIPTGFISITAATYVQKPNDPKAIIIALIGSNSDALVVETRLDPKHAIPFRAVHAKHVSLTDSTCPIGWIQTQLCSTSSAHSVSIFPTRDYDYLVFFALFNGPTVYVKLVTPLLIE